MTPPFWIRAAQKQSKKHPWKCWRGKTYVDWSVAHRPVHCLCMYNESIHRTVGLQFLCLDPWWLKFLPFVPVRDTKHHTDEAWSTNWQCRQGFGKVLVCSLTPAIQDDLPWSSASPVTLLPLHLPYLVVTASSLSKADDTFSSFAYRKC